MEKLFTSTSSRFSQEVKDPHFCGGFKYEEKTRRGGGVHTCCVLRRCFWERDVLEGDLHRNCCTVDAALHARHV
jgi:hypothetical protein